MTIVDYLGSHLLNEGGNVLENLSIWLKSDTKRHHVALFGIDHGIGAQRSISEPDGRTSRRIGQMRRGPTITSALSFVERDVLEELSEPTRPVNDMPDEVAPPTRRTGDTEELPEPKRSFINTVEERCDSADSARMRAAQKLGGRHV